MSQAFATDLVVHAFRGQIAELEQLVQRVRLSGGDSAVTALVHGEHGCARDERGRGALHAAVRGNRMPVLRFLLNNGADPNAIEAGGSSVLQQAVLTNNAAAASLLLESGASSTQVDAHSGRTASEEAAARGHSTVAAVLARFGTCASQATTATSAGAGAQTAVLPPVPPHAVCDARLGRFEVGIFHPKTAQNVGTLLRSAYQLGADAVFTVGRRYKRHGADTLNAAKHLTLEHFEDLEPMLQQRRAERPTLRVVGIEKGGSMLADFEHPEDALYLLGAEDYGLRQHELDLCDDVVTIEAVRQPMFNVAVAGSVVMHHRLLQRRIGTQSKAQFETASTTSATGATNEALQDPTSQSVTQRAHDGAPHE